MAIGAAAIVLALSAGMLYERLAIVALDQKSTSVAVGTNMTVLRVWGEDLGGGKTEAHYDQLENVTIENTRKVVGIPGLVPAEQRGKIAVWQTGVISKAVGIGDMPATEELVTFDRRTGLTTGDGRDKKSAGTLDDPQAMRPIKHAGLFFKFPFNVEKKAYPWWDGDMERAATMEFVREETIAGVDTFVFVQRTPVTPLKSVSVPAQVFGGTGGMVDAVPFYGNTRTVWVEPNTGVVIKGQEELDKTLRGSLGTVVTTKGTLAYNDATVRANANEYRVKGQLLGFLRDSLTSVGLIVGGLALAAGLVLLLTGRASRPAARTADGVAGLGVSAQDSRRQRRARV
ncbi:DUF3068 domain-containing protein [Intrasporangium calvum]|uniref:DUF3068 domain-containing protein n=1 Tax=Intrasporangium calvum TaxID=53358 RepID=A0ABT5GCB7_9MICO|nr:DUF3068 domain-containing protein [Intrasporangium calvum]MDC5695863.1 DUF3068 domain-containing protein [Intrasporangium calvum]